MPSGGPETGDVELLSARRLAVRGVAAITVLVMLVLGTWRGGDHDFPFAPFSMFASRHDRDGFVPSAYLEVTDSTGRTMRVGSARTGMRRAEIEGQLPELIAHPEKLRDVADAHRRRHPGEPVWVRVAVRQIRYWLRAGGVVRTDDVILTEWRAPLAGSAPGAARRYRSAGWRCSARSSTCSSRSTC